MRPRADVPRSFRVIAAIVIGIVRLLRWRIDARGYHHVPAGGAVLTWNHTSHVDFVATALPLYRRTGRWLRFLALQELWDSRLLGWIPRLAHCVPVPRASPEGRHEALAHAVDALEAGDLVMVAPEGTISESFELLPFRAGPARMAQAAGVPLVPTASWGSHRFSTTGHRPSLRRGWRLPITVRVGAPIHVGPDDDPIAATRLLHERTEALLEEARAAHPLGAPAGAWWVPAALGGGAPPADEVLRRYRPGQPLTEGHWRHERRRRRGG